MLRWPFPSLLQYTTIHSWTSYRNLVVDGNKLEGKQVFIFSFRMIWKVARPYVTSNLYRSLKFIFGAGGMKEQHISKFLQGEISYHSQPITITGDLINLWKTWEFYWISSRTETGYYFNRFLQVTETSRTHWNGGNFLPADEMGEVIWPISIFQRERLGFEDDKWLRCLWELGYLLPSRKYVCKSTICRYYRLTPDRCVENKAPFCCGVAVSETGESIYAQWYGFHIEAERRGWASA